MRIYAAQLNPTIGAFEANTAKILAAIESAREAECGLILFPELAICGYPPEDLVLLEPFVETCGAKLQQIIEASRGLAVIVGLVRRDPGGEKPLHNSAAIIEDGKLLGFQDKTLLPTYDVFDEQRYFDPSQSSTFWTLQGMNFAVTICEDIWRDMTLFTPTDYRRNVIGELTGHDIHFHLNLSASPYSYGKFPFRIDALAKTAKQLDCPALLCNQVGGNDSLVFDGQTFLVDNKGNLCAAAKGFEEDALIIDTDAIPAPITQSSDSMAELYNALVLGVRDYFHKSGFQKACLGLSGGVDSSLVACIGADALGPESVYGILMPSPFSSEHSIEDAEQLAKNLGIKTLTLPIETLYQAYLSVLTPHFGGKPSDATEENIQARVRGMLLMAISNKHGYIVLSTGNKSENAMGYATLYGDMCGGLAVINDVAKLQVYELCRYLNKGGERVPQHVLTKPPSAELAPDQKDSDTLPPYTVVDPVLEDYVEHHLSPEEIAKKRKLDLALVQDLIKRIHQNEYKRRQAPPGLRVTEKAFSVGRRFPIVQRWV